MTTKTKGIVTYLLIAFGMAWLLWEIPIRLGASPANPLVFQFAALPGAFAPAVAAIIVRKWVTREGFDDLGLRPNLKRWRYYLIGWLLPFAGFACILLLAMALGAAQPDFTLRRGIESLLPEGLGEVPPMPGFFWPLLPVQLLFGALLATPVLLGEELGWRGYLQVRLFADHPLLAAVVTGLIWGAWHYPINVRGYNYPGSPILGLIVFPVSTVLLSIILGWLQLKAGSVWAAALGHAATNSIGGSLAALLFAGGPKLIYASYLGMLGWIPLGALCAWIVLTGQLEHEGDIVVPDH